MISIYDYHPIRALLFWILFAAAIISWSILNTDYILNTISTLKFIEINVAWINIVAAILSRSFKDGFCLMMIITGTGFLLYAVAQLITLRRECSMSARSSKLLLLNQLTGRPLLSLSVLAADTVHRNIGVDLLFYPIRHGQTLFPAVGFLGTVIGISDAVRSLPSVMKDHTVDNLLSGLHIAFDTTFIGLIVAALLGIILMLLDVNHAQLKYSYKQNNADLDMPVL